MNAREQGKELAIVNLNVVLQESKNTAELNHKMEILYYMSAHILATHAFNRARNFKLDIGDILEETRNSISNEVREIWKNGIRTKTIGKPSS